MAEIKHCNEDVCRERKCGGVDTCRQNCCETCCPLTLPGYLSHFVETKKSKKLRKHLKVECGLRPRMSTSRATQLQHVSRSPKEGCGIEASCFSLLGRPWNCNVYFFGDDEQLASIISSKF